MIRKPALLRAAATLCALLVLSLGLTPPAAAAPAIFASPIQGLDLNPIQKGLPHQFAEIRLPV